MSEAWLSRLSNAAREARVGGCSGEYDRGKGGLGLDSSPGEFLLSCLSPQSDAV